MPTSLSIVVADDHPVILIGLAAAIQQFSEQKIVAQARDGCELLKTLEHARCDIVVTDYCMHGDPQYDGMHLLARLRERHRSRPVVVCTMARNPTLLRRMRHLGVHGLVSKSDSLVHVGHAIQAAAKGLCYDSPAIIAQSASDSDEPEAAQALSPRECEVVRLYVGGLTISEIARALGTNIKTVSTQKTSALRKLGLVREVDLIPYARSAGLSASR